MLRCILCLFFVFFIAVPVAYANTKTIQIETIPSGASIEVGFFEWGKYVEKKTCVSPCKFQITHKSNYTVDIKKDNYAYYSIKSSDPYYIKDINTLRALRSIKTPHPHIEFLTELFTNNGHVFVNKIDAIEHYKVILETKEQRNLRRKKRYLATECTIIFKQHFMEANAPARPCNASAPSLPRKFGKNKASCDFTYDVTYNGEVKNIRNINCSHSSLINSIQYIEKGYVNRWTFFPKIENGITVDTIGLKSNVDFFNLDARMECPEIFAKYESVESHDASVCKRKSPNPLKGLKGKQVCTATFDITPEGTTTNISIDDCTTKKIKKPSLKAVETWLYVPKHVDGVPSLRRGVKAKITFVGN